VEEMAGRGHSGKKRILIWRDDGGMKSIRLLVICKPSSASPVVSGSAVVRHKKEAKKTIVAAGPFDLNTVMNVNNASRSTGSRVLVHL